MALDPTIDDFEIDLEAQTATHKPDGMTFTFYKYHNLDDLVGPASASNYQDSEWDPKELSAVATEAYKRALRRAGQT